MTSNNFQKQEFFRQYLIARWSESTALKDISYYAIVYSKNIKWQKFFTASFNQLKKFTFSELYISYVKCILKLFLKNVILSVKCIYIYLEKSITKKTLYVWSHFLKLFLRKILYAIISQVVVFIWNSDTFPFKYYIVLFLQDEMQIPFQHYILCLLMLMFL